MENSQDTIIARATPEGHSALAILRMSGPQSFSILSNLGCPYKGKPGFLKRSLLKWDGRILEDAMVVFFKNPHSYTGEDLVEIHCHGNPELQKSIIGACLQNGARLAEKGEFSLRGFLNGKMDLIQAEAVHSLIFAKGGLEQRKSLENLLDNHLGKKIMDLREKILSVFIQVEALIDFPEEDIPELDRKLALKILGEVKRELELLWKDRDRCRFIQSGLKIAIVGEVNAGKSSLLNQFLGHDRSIVTDIPGTTRDYIEGTLNYQGLLLHFVDTAGFRATENEVEKIGIQKSMESMVQSDLVLWVRDLSQAFQETQIPLLGEVPLFTVFNKTDIHPNKKIKETSSPLRLKSSLKTFYISALTGEGIPNLLDEIVRFSIGLPSEIQNRYLLNERQFSCIERCKDPLEGAMEALEKKFPEDLIASDLHGVLEELGRVSGETAPDEILNRIFHTFCVGK